MNALSCVQYSECVCTTGSSKNCPGRRSVVPSLSLAEDTSMSALGVLRSPNRTNSKLKCQSRGLFWALRAAFKLQWGRSKNPLLSGWKAVLWTILHPRKAHNSFKKWNVNWVPLSQVISCGHTKPSSSEKRRRMPLQLSHVAVCTANVWWTGLWQRVDKHVQNFRARVLRDHCLWRKTNSLAEGSIGEVVCCVGVF